MTFDSFPLTPVQHAMVGDWLRRPRSGLNVEQWIATFRETVDAAALRRAWFDVVEQFGMLRASIDLSDPAEPRQVMHELTDERRLHAWRVHDWRGRSRESIEVRRRSLLETGRRTGLDLTRPPLWRVDLVTLSDDETQFICTYHHVLLCGRSLVEVGRALETAYEARRSRVAPKFAIESSFASFAAFVTECRSRDGAASALYWQRYLADRPPVRLPQPHKLANCDQEPERHASVEIERLLNESTTFRLHSAARRADATTHAMVQAAWGLTLAAFSGEPDHVFGSVRACRRLPVDGIDRMVGMLINTVPFRVQVRYDEPIRELLARLRDAQVAHRPHETTAASDIARCVGRPADEPLLPTLLMFTDRRPEAMWHKDGRPHPTRTVQLLECSEFPLALCVAVDERTTIRLEYDSARYDAMTADRIADHFLMTLTELSGDVDRLVGELPSLTPEARRTLLEWSRGPEPTEAPPSISALIERRMAEQAGDPAILAGERTIDYAELRRMTLAAAGRLRAEGVRRGNLVGVFCERSPETTALILAIWRLGAIYVPLDPKYPSARLGTIVADAAPVVVVHDRPPVEGLLGDAPTNDAPSENCTPGEGRPYLVALSTLFADDSGLATATSPIAPAGDLKLEAELGDRAVVLYTSGSTGQPKGVVLTHANLANQLAYILRTMALAPDDRLMPVSSINFDASLEEHFSPLAAGATLVFAEPGTLDSCARTIEFVERSRLTILDMPTSLWRELTNYLHGERREYPDCVRAIMMGGEAATRAVYERFLQVGGRRVRWINAYGPTEATICSICYEHRPERDERQSAAPPIGRPIDGTTAFVVDRRGRLTPPGVGGELLLGGAGVADGYLNRDDLTHERFIASPSADLPPGRYYRTGDEVRYRDDGELEYLGRLDGQVKLRGFRIEPGEIEAALLQHATVRDAAVVVRNSPAGTEYLAAYLVLHSGATWDEHALSLFAADRLPQYMMPRAYVQLDALPLSVNGKIERRALPEPCYAESAVYDRGAPTREPTELERRLLEVWRNTLQLDELTIDDDFFRLGGDSLRAMTLAAKLEQTLGRTVSAAMLLAAPTVAQFAARLESEAEVRGDEAAAPLVLLREGDPSRPLFFIHSLAGDVWIYRELVAALKTESAVYGLQMPGLDGRAVATSDDVEAWAALYLEHVRAVQPFGPYRFAGYSSGGLLAFEMARQAAAVDEQVEFLGLIDSGVPTALEHRLAPSPLQRKLQWLRAVPGAVLELLKQPAAEQRRRIGRRLKTLIRRYVYDSRPTPPAGDLNDREVLECFAEDISFFSEERLNLIRRHYRALDRYDVPPVDFSARLFRSARQPMFALPTAAMGWEHLIRGRLEVHHVGGAHATLMQSPHVDRLAAAIDAALRSGSSDDARSASELSCSACS